MKSFSPRRRFWRTWNTRLTLSSSMEVMQVLQLENDFLLQAGGRERGNGRNHVGSPERDAELRQTRPMPVQEWFAEQFDECGERIEVDQGAQLALDLARRIDD